MKAIIYSRVSTQEQAKSGYSLDSQEQACREFATREGYELDHIFREEGESAKTTDRTELYNLTRFIQANHHSLHAVIVWKFDRFARSLVDQLNLIRNFAAYGIRVLSATEINEDTAVGRLTRNMVGAFSQFENEVKAERTILGMKAAIRSGRWMWRPPIGYRREIGADGRTVMVPGPHAQLIAKAFEMAGSGTYKQAEIADFLRSFGMQNVSKGLVGRVLTNPLYCGIIRLNWFPDDIRASHVAIVSRELFDRVQLIISGRLPTNIKRRSQHPDFSLRRFVSCGICGVKLTGGYSRGRHGGRFPYYFCRTTGCSLNIRKQDLERQFSEYLKDFQLKKKMLKAFFRVFKDLWKTKMKSAEDNQKTFLHELRKLQDEKQRAAELLLKGTFDEETYSSTLTNLRMEIAVKRTELHDAQTEKYDIDAVIAFAQQFLSNISKLWVNASLEGKLGVQNVIFPLGVSYSKKEGFRTPATSLIFKVMTDVTTPKIALGVPKGI